MTTPSTMPGPTGSYMPGPPRPYMPGPPGPYMQPPYGQPPQPPKKRRTWLIVLLVTLPVMLIGLVSCGALIATAGKSITEASTEASQSQQADDDPTNSTPVPSAKRDEDAKLRKEPGFLSRADFGTRWPLTVEAGVVSCEPHSGGLGSVIFMDPEGKRYAVNGTAMAHYPQLPEIDRIWAPDATNPGAKINIGPVIDRGLALC
jgi:Protein of unknown function (DUF2511)